MTSLREAARPALEALEWISAQKTGGMIQRKATEPITALGAALAEPVQGPPIWEQLAQIGHEALEAGALAEPQEPDPWGAGYEAGYAAGVREHTAEPVQEPVACLIGTKGSAFDSPTTKRAYTYAEQPGNVVASRLGLACNAAASQSAGDSIDRGLGLLQALQKQGFGVFDLGAEYAAPPQRPAEPVGVVTSMVKGGATWHRWPADMPDGTPLYTAPPQSKPMPAWLHYCPASDILTIHGRAYSGAAFAAEALATALPQEQAR